MTAALDMLPTVRGTYTEKAPLKDLVWFRAGGPADILFRPADVDDLCAFMAEKPADLAVSVIGVGSNLLVRDGGIPGVVIRLPSAFGRIEPVGDTRLRAGAAALDAAVARAAADAGIAGLEFLRGIPGTIGGALKMNAGCYGREIKDIFVEAHAVDSRGRLLTLVRRTWVSPIATRRAEDVIFVDVLSRRARRRCPTIIRERMDELVEQREATQPIKAKTGGSTFTNPPGHKAWQLIDEAGCRGLMRGAAQVSREALQLPDQHRRCHGGRYRRLGRRSARAGEGEVRHPARMGNQAGGAAK